MKKNTENRGTCIKYICFVLIPCFFLMGFVTYHEISSWPTRTVQTYCTACMKRDWGSVYGSLSPCVRDTMVNGREAFIETISQQPDVPLSRMSSFQIEEKEGESQALTKDYVVHYTESGSAIVQMATIRVVKQKNGGWLVAPDSKMEQVFLNRK